MRKRGKQVFGMETLPLPGLDPIPASAALVDRHARAVETLGEIAQFVAELRGAARAAAEASRAGSTERAYETDWRDFNAFAARIGRGSQRPAEPETVALYVADLARRGRAAATIARRLTAIAVYHRAAGLISPTDHDVVRAVVRGVRRQVGIAQRQKTALVLDPLRTVIAQIPGDVRGLRDRALLLIGWAAALRRSEIAALVVADLRVHSEGVVIRLRRSKTDQEAAGDSVAVPCGSDPATCPVLALGAWLDVAGSEGPVFRQVDRHANIGVRLSANAVAKIIRERAAAADVAGDFAGHSLRAGFATTAAALGRSESAIMRHGRWKNAQVARRYIRHGSQWIDNAATDIGL
jgi:site-specific recombinase XerD